MSEKGILRKNTLGDFSKKEKSKNLDWYFSQTEKMIFSHTLRRLLKRSNSQISQTA